MHARFLALALALTLPGCLGGFSGPQADLPFDPVPPEPVTYEAIHFRTEVGPITLILYPEAAPKTVELMKTLVSEGYYDGREFNRVVPGHVIQLVAKDGGAVTDDARRVPLEVDARYHFSAGAAGIARDSDPNSGGPEFFIMDFGTSHLDGNYTVWGQVIEGLDAVHKAARVPAVNSPATPGAGPVPPMLVGTTDRMAIDAVAILEAEVTTITLPGIDAEKYPMQVAKNHREGDFRHSLDWPRSLRAGAPTDLTWYVRPYNGTAPPAASEIQIRVAGETLAIREDPDAPGAFHWQWTPRSAGEHEATILRSGKDWATLRVTVPA